MQLALTPEVLFPLGACAVVAVAVIAVVVVLVRGRRTAGDETLVPTTADWTGEAATADPTPTAAVPVPVLPQRLTVAEAIAVREADTAPLPVSSIAFLGTRPATAVPMSTGPLPRVPQPGGSGSEDATAPAGPEPVAAVPEAPAAPGPGTPDAVDPAEAPATAVPDAVPAVTEPDPEPSTGPVSRPVSTGSGAVVAAAVAHALAARAAAGREPGAPAPAPSRPVPSRTADARDRLLAVLLADPARAVGAAEELATCRGQLSEVLARLASSGLSTDQLARLSGFSAEQVSTLLAQQGARR